MHPWFSICSPNISQGTPQLSNQYNTANYGVPSPPYYVVASEPQQRLRDVPQTCFSPLPASQVCFLGANGELIFGGQPISMQDLQIANVNRPLHTSYHYSTSQNPKNLINPTVLVKLVPTGPQLVHHEGLPVSGHGQTFPSNPVLPMLPPNLSFMPESMAQGKDSTAAGGKASQNSASRQTKVKKDSGLSLTCFFCNGSGHKAIHCPKNPDWCGELSALCTVHNKTRCMSSLKQQDDGTYICIPQSACRRVVNNNRTNPVSISDQGSHPSQNEVVGSEHKVSKSKPEAELLCHSNGDSISGDQVCESTLDSYGAEGDLGTTSKIRTKKRFLASAKEHSTWVNDVSPIVDSLEPTGAIIHYHMPSSDSSGIETTKTPNSVLHLSGLSLNSVNI